MSSNLSEAVFERRSYRSYEKIPLRNEDIKRLEYLIKKYNREAGLNIQLCVGCGKAFSDIKKSYGMFSGIENCFAMIGSAEDADLREKIGYYGEMLVLQATVMGLGTCWIGGAFDKHNLGCVLGADECVVCVVAVGYPQSAKNFRNVFLRTATHLKTKTISEMTDCDAEPPDWFKSGVVFVERAPSAVNKLPTVFSYKNGKVFACVPNKFSYQAIDMGIAKLHFELGAGSGEWDFGNGAEFHY